MDPPQAKWSEAENAEGRPGTVVIDVYFAMVVSGGSWDEFAIA